MTDPAAPTHPFVPWAPGQGNDRCAAEWTEPRHRLVLRPTGVDTVLCNEPEDDPIHQPAAGSPAPPAVCSGNPADCTRAHLLRGYCDGAAGRGTADQPEPFPRCEHGAPTYACNAGGTADPAAVRDEPPLDNPLAQRIRQAIYDEAPNWTESFDGGPGAVCSVADAAVAAARFAAVVAARFVTGTADGQPEPATTTCPCEPFAEQLATAWDEGWQAATDSAPSGTGFEDHPNPYRTAGKAPTTELEPAGCTCNAADLATYTGPDAVCVVHGEPDLQDTDDGYPRRDVTPVESPLGGPSAPGLRVVRLAPSTVAGCPNDCTDGVVACWNPGGPCPEPNAAGCDTCGPCNHCAAAGSAAPTTAEPRDLTPKQILDAAARLTRTPLNPDGAGPADGKPATTPAPGTHDPGAGTPWTPTEQAAYRTAARLAHQLEEANERLTRWESFRDFLEQDLATGRLDASRVRTLLGLYAPDDQADTEDG